MQQCRTVICLAVVLFSAFTSACTPLPFPWLVNRQWASDMQNGFAGFAPISDEKIKNSVIKRSFDSSFEDVWEATLSIVMQYATVVRTYKHQGSGTIFVFEFDGLYDEKGKSFRFVEFPFYIFVGSDDEKASVWVRATR